jgi:S-adenosylmethionine:tRNA-ribosyltransferase-isomerase (queuine synthetase)
MFEKSIEGAASAGTCGVHHRPNLLDYVESETLNFKKVVANFGAVF